MENNQLKKVIIQGENLMKMGGAHGTFPFSK